MATWARPVGLVSVGVSGAGHALDCRGSLRRRARSAPWRAPAGITTVRPRTASATRRAEPGPSEIPHGPWPAATNSPPTSGSGPSSGRPSALIGRAQARTETTCVPASAGTKRVPRSTSAGATSVGSGCSGRNVEPSAETPPRGDEAEQRVEPAVGVRQVLDPALLERVARRLREPQLHVDAPQRRDRAPGARGIDERGGPRPGRDDDRSRRRRCRPRAHAGRAAVLDHRRGRGALDQLRARGARPGGEGLGGGGGRHGQARVEQERGQALGERRLGRVQRRGVERLGAQLGEARGEVGAGRLERGRILGDHEDADGLARAARSRGPSSA